MVAANSNSTHRAAHSQALGLRFLLLAALSIALLVVDHRDRHLDTVRKAIGAAVFPLRVIVDAPVSTWNWLAETTATRNELQSENDRLHDERLLTHARLQRFAALEAENARLRAMLEATEVVRNRVRVAEIMSVSANPFRHMLVIDKGSREGVFNGQAMIDAEGVVGQVTQTGLLSSQGLLISDPDHALPVEVNRNGLRTIARGTGAFDQLDLPFLPNNADIQAGDLLVTSGLGGAFPAGYPVAIVDTVIRVPQEPFADVSAVPSAALNQVRELMLVWIENTEYAVPVDNSDTPQDTSAESAEPVAQPNTENQGEAGG